MKQIRQGDVLLVAVEQEPKGLSEQPSVPSIVLEHGEATGHAHRINEPAKVKLYHDAQAAQYLRVMEETPIVHEEHSAILLKAGLFRRAYQVEEKRGELRRVVD